MIYLDEGHHSTEGKGCVMDWKMRLCACKQCAALRAKGKVTDSPPCTNQVITAVAQQVNDKLRDDERQRLLAYAERIDRCRRTNADHRINVRLAIWVARKVAHLVPGRHRAVAAAAIDAAERWLDDPSEQNRQVAAAAYAAAYAAAWDAAAYAAAAISDPIDFLDELLDQWEKAAAEEGVLWEGDDEWAEEFCAFAERWAEAAEAK